MAERRMFAKAIVLSDAFLDMPLSARCLYFTLGMMADDDGFINSPKAIIRQTGATPEDLEILLQKRYLLSFESGVVVIKHWRINNYLQGDRHKKTTYVEELETLELDEKNAYKEKGGDVYTRSCIQNVYKMYTQNSIDKNSIDKSSKERVERKGASAPPARHEYGEYKNVLLSDDELEKLKSELGIEYQKYINSLSSYMKSTGKSYKDHLATIRNWARRDREKAKETPKASGNKFINYTQRDEEMDESKIYFIGGKNGG